MSRVLHAGYCTLIVFLIVLCITAGIDAKKKDEKDKKEKDLPKVQYSVRRGFYSQPITVGLKFETAGASICYSLNSQVPKHPACKAYTTPISITTTTTICALAFDSTLKRISDYSCSTYVYLDAIIAAPYMQTSITKNALWGPQMKTALTIQPSVFITVGNININDDAQAMFEFFDPKTGDHVEAGCEVKYVGGSSVHWMPEKSIRVYFGGDFGPDELEFPLFKGFEFYTPSVNKFDQLNLRGAHHDGIFFPSNLRTFIKNRWMDEMMFAMGHLSTHGRYVHVYLNGAYNGHYMLRERFGAPFLSDNLGGKKKDYEAVNSGRAYDGSGKAWKFIDQNKKSWKHISPYLDINNFIDYHLLNYYAGNTNDWLGYQNWAAGGASNPMLGGYKWYNTDSDTIFRGINDNMLITRWGGGADIRFYGPGGIFYTQNQIKDPDFVIRVQERVQKHLFGGGVLTTTRAVASFKFWERYLNVSLIPESARYGNYNKFNWTLDTWKKELTTALQYPARRTEILIAQFAKEGLVSTLTMPQLSVVGSKVTFTLPPAQGEIWYTIGGVDPYQSETRYPLEAYGVATQSSTAFAPFGTAMNAIDSDYDGNWRDGKGTTHTTLEDNPWWEVDFTYSLKVSKVNIYNRADCCSERLFPFVAQLLSKTGAVVATQTFSTQVPSPVPWRVGSTVTASKLRITLPGKSRYLSLAEVEVFAQDGNTHTSAKKAINGATLDLSTTTTITARTKLNNKWSPPVTTTIRVNSPCGATACAVNDSITITEIMYEPTDGDLEFVELRNMGTATYNLEGARFSTRSSIKFTFPPGSLLDPGKYLVVARSPIDFFKKYSFWPHGKFTGTLKSTGYLRIKDLFGKVVVSVLYGGDSWPKLPKDGGLSLVPVEGSKASPNTAAYWRPSTKSDGSPGAADPQPAAKAASETSTDQSSHTPSQNLPVWTYVVLAASVAVVVVVVVVAIVIAKRHTSPSERI